MTAKNKVIGNNLEREVVKSFKAAGVNAKRAYASNGESLGLHAEVDVVTYVVEEELLTGTIQPIVDLKLQCKRKLKLPKFLGFSEHVDGVVFKEKAGTKYIMLRLDEFIERYL